MAFYTDQDEEDQDPNAPAQTGESATIGSSGGGAAAGAAEAGASAAASEPQGQNFVGISQYINANKPQSEKLAGQVADNVNQKAQAVDTDLSNTENSFNQAADAQKVNVDSGIFDEVKNNAQGVASDAAKKNSFDTAKNATYSGPQTLNETGNWGDLQSALDKAKQAKAATGTEEGRMGLIKEVSNNPRQSQGALTFDNLLLQSNPNSAGMLQQAGSNLNDIDTRIGASQAGAAAKAKSIADANAGLAANAKDALTQGYTGLKSSLTDKEAAKDAEQQSYVDSLKKSIASGSLTADQLKALNLGGDYKTYGTNAADYLDYVDGADINSVANQDDLARQQALQSLAGDYDLGGDIISSASPLGEVGQGYNFRGADLDAATQKIASEFNSKAQPLQDQYNALMKTYNDNLPGAGGSMAGTTKSQILKARDAKQKADVIQGQINALATQYNTNKTLNAPGKVAGVQGQLMSPQRIGV